MKSPRSLIVFIKNPVAGKVKTRLANDIGDKQALKIYIQLLNYTASITSGLNLEVHLFYSDFIPEQQVIFQNYHGQYVQRGAYLGDRMSEAFKTILKKSEKVVLIGSDCGELTVEILNEAFSTLTFADVVLGPACDGGYYLIGMKKEQPAVFESIEWSTDTVFQSTIRNILKTDADLALLTTLRDVDTLDDWMSLNW